LDIIGDRWNLVIIQELLKRSSRYSELARRLPGISTTVLADRLRKLEVCGVVKRQLGPVGTGVTYSITDRGHDLDEALEILRRWGVNYLTDPSADGAKRHAYDLHYVEGIDSLDDGEFGLIVDDIPSTLRFSGGHLEQTAGEPIDPLLVVRTSSGFMDRWAAGSSTWDDGLSSGEVTLSGLREHWNRWLAATGYLLAYGPDEDAA
jgi:DNA-binding HxlR family transcriptional regulator